MHITNNNVIKMKESKKIIGRVAIAMTLFVSLGMKAEEHEDSIINVAFGKMAYEDVNNAVTTVKTSTLSKILNDQSSLIGLQGMVGGYNGNVWNQSALVLVDGVPRDASLVRASEVESVTVLKDAASVALYGSRGAKGVILITTKRGKNEPMHIDFRGTTGINVPKIYPKYLDAASYMTLYNEACRNDGISEKYDAVTIYNTASGKNPYRYPDVNYYDSEYLRDFYFNANMTGEIYGGNEKTHYYVNLGMEYNNTLLKYGENKGGNTSRFNVRGNVDMTLTKWLKASTNATMIIGDTYSGRGSFWSEASTLRPNWFSALLPISMMDTNVSQIQEYIQNSNHLIDGKYLLGAISTNTTNALASLLAEGYSRNKNRQFMFDVVLNADLSSITQGLSFKTTFSVDYLATYSEAFKESYATYEPTWSNVNGKDIIVALKQYNKDESSTNEYVGESTYDQTMLFCAQFDYNRTFDRLHNVSTTLLGWGYQQQYSGDSGHSSSDYHRTSNVNLGLRATYNYNHKYYAEFNGAVIHSAKLAEGHRNAFSPSVTLAWRLSKEKWLRIADFINDLKLSVSFANLHQDLDISDYYMYKGYFTDKGGWYQWHDSYAGGNTTGSVRGENLDLTFITRKEFRVGIDATMFNKLLTINANYFNQMTSGLLTQGSSTIYPSFFYISSTQSFLPYINYNKDKRYGLDFAITAQKTLGDLYIKVGFNGMIYGSKAVRRDEVAEYDYQLAEGQPLNTARGYICEGFWQSQEEIDNAEATSTFGTVRPGDLKYKDINGDGTIDSNDQVVLGKYTSPFTFGVNLTLKYKNFTFFALGNGQTGGVAFKNNSYWWVTGTSKFSETVMNRWTEETALTASYPRLTTGTGTNNYRNSTFWLYSTNAFRLTNVQLTYDFKNKPFGESFVKGLSLYIGGSSLLTIAKEHEYMEMNIGSSPQCRNFYFGLKAQF